MKKLLLILSLVFAVSVHAQEGTPLRGLFGSGAPNPNLANKIGTQYIDTSNANLWICTAVILTPTVSQCTWTQPASSSGTLSTLTGGVAPAGPAFDFSGVTLIAPNSFFQSNGIPNGTQTGHNLVNSTGVSGLSWTNPGGGNNSSGVIANIDATPGLKVATITETTPLQNDIVAYNASGVKVNKTTGIPGRAVAGNDSASCVPGTGDRGTANPITAASVTETLPNPAAANCGSNFYSRWFFFQNGGTLKSTSGTLNGIAAGTGILYPANTWADAISKDNSTWDVYAARAVKAGTNATETINPDGTVSINVPAGGGSSVWSALTAPVANLSLAMAGNLSTFNTTTALAQMFAWKNTTAAVVGTSQGSPIPAVCGRAWTGADAEDCLTWQDVPGNGVNAPITFQFAHTGTSTGQVDTTFPGPVKSGGATAGFVFYTQNPTSAAIEPCNAVNTICEQAPVVVASYLVTKPGVAAQGLVVGTLSGSTITQGFSGDSNHSATVTIGSGTSISSTQLCSSANCPAGTYAVSVYLDITTACGTTGTYIVNLIYTDDQGAKTVPVNINGTGAVPATGSLTTTSTANFGENNQIIRLASGTINYSTTATACGTAGPMVGKLYLAAVPVM